MAFQTLAESTNLLSYSLFLSSNRSNKKQIHWRNCKHHHVFDFNETVYFEKKKFIITFEKDPTFVCVLYCIIDNITETNNCWHALSVLHTECDCTSATTSNDYMVTLSSQMTLQFSVNPFKFFSWHWIVLLFIPFKVWVLLISIRD